MKTDALRERKLESEKAQRIVAAMRESVGTLGAAGATFDRVAQLAGVEGLSPLLSRNEAPQLVIVNLDPNAQQSLKAVGHLPRQHPGIGPPRP